LIVCYLVLGLFLSASLHTISYSYWAYQVFFWNLKKKHIQEYKEQGYWHHSRFPERGVKYQGNLLLGILVSFLRELDKDANVYPLDRSVRASMICLK